MLLPFADSANAVLITFLIYISGVFLLAALSNRLLQSKSFLSEYFLGSRSLGVWAFALTFAATSSSGGSFMGFPSKIYTHGWVLALWIGSYMVVPICTMGLLGKRLNQVSRISGAITIPDVIRDRFNSAKFGLLAIVLIVFFMSFNLIAQFKAGSMILKTLLGDMPAFKSAAQSFGELSASLGILDSALGDQYVLCLLVFGLAVIVYTTYGGFHAVVWTDVMQGIVMVVGVVIMLPLAIAQVGGMENATKQLAQQTPPRKRFATIVLAEPAKDEKQLAGSWILLSQGSQKRARVFRLLEEVEFAKGERSVNAVEVLEITAESDIDRILSGRTNAAIDSNLSIESVSKDDEKYGTLTIAVENADSKEAQIPAGTWLKYVNDDGENRAAMVARASTLEAGDAEVSGVRVIEPTDQDRIESILNAQSEAVSTRFTVVSRSAKLKSPLMEYGDSQRGVYVTGPGPSPTDPHGFLPLSLAISFFFMWAISGAGQPSNMVRLMAFNNARTLKRSIFTVAIYYTAIYFPLVIIFTCARILMPGMEGESDRIMPAMAVFLTENAGFGWLAGLLIAAPFAAVMSTVDSFLLMISSALVRDIYQRNINPEAEEKMIKRLSYIFTLLVGVIAMIGAINPPQFLQDIIVYVGSGLAACFLAPMVFALYWPRSNVQGCTAGMLCGFGAHLAMYVAGIFANGSFFRPYRLLNFDPIIVGLLTSFAMTLIATRLSPPPPRELVEKYFYKQG